jgi:hypothetical protein
VLDDLAQSGEQTAEELSKRFENSSFYHRFSVDSGLENLSITGWNEDELGTVNAHTKVYIEKVWSSLSAVAEILVKDEGCVTFGQLSKYSTFSQEPCSFLSAQVDVKPAMAKCIPRLSPFFIERRDVFDFMEQRLIRDACNTQRLFVIYGMGGSGKTQIASFFGRQNKDRYGSFVRLIVTPLTITQVQTHLLYRCQLCREYQGRFPIRHSFPGRSTFAIHF